MSLLSTAAALLEMTGIAQTAIDVRDGEISEEGVVCPAKGEPLRMVQEGAPTGWSCGHGALHGAWRGGRMDKGRFAMLKGLGWIWSLAELLRSAVTALERKSP